MKNQNNEIIFDKERASTHDQKREKLAPMRDSLHLFIRMILSSLPDNANILCVGSGTGSEIIELASAYPNWTFTAVEPSQAMLDVCKDRIDELGISKRCNIHHGYLDSFHGDAPFDAATSLLVSQFIPDKNKRKIYFQDIASHLVPGGYLINADLSSDTESTLYTELLDVWIRTMKYSGIPSDEINKLKQNISIVPQKQIEALITSGGFNQPVLFFQALLIHAWFTRRAN